jgi:hypothetical protein
VPVALRARGLERGGLSPVFPFSCKGGSGIFRDASGVEPIGGGVDASWVGKSFFGELLPQGRLFVWLFPFPLKDACPASSSETPSWPSPGSSVLAHGAIRLSVDAGREGEGRGRAPFSGTRDGAPRYRRVASGHGASGRAVRVNRFPPERERACKRPRLGSRAAPRAGVACLLELSDCRRWMKSFFVRATYAAVVPGIASRSGSV